MPCMPRSRWPSLRWSPRRRPAPRLLSHAACLRATKGQPRTASYRWVPWLFSQSTRPTCRHLPLTADHRPPFLTTTPLHCLRSSRFPLIGSRSKATARAGFVGWTTTPHASPSHATRWSRASRSGSRNGKATPLTSTLARLFPTSDIAKSLKFNIYSSAPTFHPLPLSYADFVKFKEVLIDDGLLTTTTPFPPRKPMRSLFGGLRCAVQLQYVAQLYPRAAMV